MTGPILAVYCVLVLIDIINYKMYDTMNGLLHIILNNINLHMGLALNLPQSVHSFRPEENLAGISKTLNIQ